MGSCRHAQNKSRSKGAPYEWRSERGTSAHSSGGTNLRGSCSANLHGSRGEEADLVEAAGELFTVGVFQDAVWADKGLQALRARGFAPDALSVIAKDTPETA